LWSRNPNHIVAIGRGLKFNLESPISDDEMWIRPIAGFWLEESALGTIFLSKVRLVDESTFGEPIPNHIVAIGRDPKFNLEFPIPLTKCGFVR
jgi:hypothetical protein